MAARSTTDWRSSPGNAWYPSGRRSAASVCVVDVEALNAAMNENVSQRFNGKWRLGVKGVAVCSAGANSILGNTEPACCRDSGDCETARCGSPSAARTDGAGEEPKGNATTRRLRQLHPVAVALGCGSGLKVADSGFQNVDDLDLHSEWKRWLQARFCTLNRLVLEGGRYVDAGCGHRIRVRGAVRSQQERLAGNDKSKIWRRSSSRNIPNES